MGAGDVAVYYRYALAQGEGGGSKKESERG